MHYFVPSKRDFINFVNAADKGMYVDAKSRKYMNCYTFEHNHDESEYYADSI